MRVKVYRNISPRYSRQKFPVYSVMALEGPAAGRVIAHATRVLIEGAEFRVSASGRARVLREKRKNVHAFVVGRLVAADFLRVRDDEALGVTALDTQGAASCGCSAHLLDARCKTGLRVYYNPYKVASFTPYADLSQPLRSAEAVRLGAEGIHALRAA